MGKRSSSRALVSRAASYGAALENIVGLLESARGAAARSVNVVMTATYWEIGRRIVELEQSGQRRAEYGRSVMVQLAADLTKRFGRGLSLTNLKQIRKFYLTFPCLVKGQATSDQSAIQKGQTASDLLFARFPLPWSHYVRLLSVENEETRRFYEGEALRCGWTVRQLDRQVSTLFYERTLASRRKTAMLRKGESPRPDDAVAPEDEIKDPFVLEFLGLKDEYSETELEDALVLNLEHFLLELGGDFAFVARQRRLRVGDEWYRVDLVFFHRVLRCLVIIDLKVGKFTHADAGQMHLYLNYAREHWLRPGENPPVGLILCAHADSAVAHYALDGLPNKVLAATYRTALPNEETLAKEVRRAHRALAARDINERASHGT